MEISQWALKVKKGIEELIEFSEVNFYLDQSGKAFTISVLTPQDVDEQLMLSIKHICDQYRPVYYFYSIEIKVPDSVIKNKIAEANIRG